MLIFRRRLPRWRRGLILAVGFLFCLHLMLPAYGHQEVAVFGPEKFIRGIGKPQTVVRHFSVTNLEGEFSITVQSGEAGSNRVTSAIIILNGVRVVGPNDFNKQIDYIQKPVDLQPENTLTFEVRGEPEAFIIVSVLANFFNNVPVAEAGKNINSRVSNRIFLDGSGSYDPDGDLITYTWFLEKPVGSTASLNDNTLPNPSFIPDVVGTYTFALIVSDGQLSSRPQSVTVTAAAVIAPPNARAGLDQEALLGSLVSLDGSGSDDPNRWPLTFLWSFDTLPAGSALSDTSISFRDTPVAQFTPDINGTYMLTLRVDNGVLTDEATVRVFAKKPNVGPNAYAGTDKAVKVGEDVGLDGRGSFDPDTGPSSSLSFLWNLVNSPPGSLADIVGADTRVPGLTPDVEGSYVARLQVSDGEASDADNVLLIADDTPPSIQFLHPDDNATVGTATPRFDIIYDDTGSGVDLNSFQILINDIDVTVNAEVTPTGSIYKPTIP